MGWILVQGAGTALAAVIEDELGDERLVQAPLFPADQLHTLPEDPHARREALRRPGRPIGSPNRKDVGMREFIRAKGYTDPLLFFAEAISRSARDLAAELGCSPYEAWQEQGRMADRLAPYLHSKRPVAVLHGGLLPSIELVDPAKAAAMFADEGSEQIQGLIDVTDAGVEQPELNSAPIVEGDQRTSAEPTVIADHDAEDGRP